LGNNPLEDCHVNCNNNNNDADDNDQTTGIHSSKLLGFNNVDTANNNHTHATFDKNAKKVLVGSNVNNNNNNNNNTRLEPDTRDNRSWLSEIYRNV
jgi:hypothetical protein